MVNESKNPAKSEISWIKNIQNIYNFLHLTCDNKFSNYFQAIYSASCRFQLLDDETCRIATDLLIGL